MAPTPPPGVTVQSIKAAKVTVLQSWIDAANEAAGLRKRSKLKRTGTKEVLQRSLADFYGLDLDAAAVPAVASHDVGSTSAGQASDREPEHAVNQRIRDHQWDHLLSLGQEWRQKTEAGERFLLQRPNYSAYIAVSIPVVSLTWHRCP